MDNCKIPLVLIQFTCKFQNLTKVSLIFDMTFALIFRPLGYAHRKPPSGLELKI
jgi:hypothetical protein